MNNENGSKPIDFGINPVPGYDIQLQSVAIRPTARDADWFAKHASAIIGTDNFARLARLGVPSADKNAPDIESDEAPSNELTELLIEAIEIAERDHTQKMMRANKKGTRRRATAATNRTLQLKYNLHKAH